jgi:hypothetical protein
MTDDQSASMSSVSSPLWDLWLDTTSCRKVAVLFLWGSFSEERMGPQFAMQSLNGPSQAEPVTVLYCLIWDSPNLYIRHIKLLDL